MTTAALAAGALGAATAPAAAEVIEPFAKHYDASLYGDFTTIGNTVMVRYPGDIPAGRAATVTYSVTVHDPVSGDGKLLNDGDVASPRSNCAAGSTGPRCGATPVVEREQPKAKVTNVPARRTAPVCSNVKNTLTLRNPSGGTRTGATAAWQVTPGSKPVASSGKVTQQSGKYVWKGTVPPHGKITVTQQVKVSCTAGAVRVITVTMPGSNCPRTTRGGDDPCTSVILARRVQARPAPHHQQAAPAGHEDASHEGPAGELADTGGDSDTMLYAGLAISLFTLGVLAVAAARSRRD